MTAGVLYKYDPTTGHISGRTSGDWPDNHPAWTLPGHVTVKGGQIPAQVTTTHDDGTVETNDALVESGWSFVLDGTGTPTKDANGHYAVVPPPVQVLPPDLLTHVFVGMVNAGYVDLASVDQAIITSVNRSLDKVGLAPIAKTTLVPVPIRTAAVSAIPKG